MSSLDDLMASLKNNSEEMHPKRLASQQLLNNAVQAQMQHAVGILRW